VDEVLGAEMAAVEIEGDAVLAGERSQPPPPLGRGVVLRPPHGVPGEVGVRELGHEREPMVDGGDGVHVLVAHPPAPDPGGDRTIEVIDVGEGRVDLAPLEGVERAGRAPARMLTSTSPASWRSTISRTSRSGCWT
jgi:hypothetical protein